MKSPTIYDSKTYFNSGRLIDKVRGCVVAAKNRQNDADTIREILTLTKLDREIKVFDFSIVDWAVAALKLH